MRVIYYFSGMARSANQERTAMEKVVIVPGAGGGGALHHEATDGSTRGGQEVEGEGKFWARVFIVVSGGKNGQGRVSRLWTGQLE